MCLSTALGACTLGPDFIRPQTPALTAESFINAPEGTLGATKDINRWWEAIDDPLLNNYVEQLLNENLEIKQAAERVIQAREATQTARSDYFPTLAAGTNASRSFTPSSLTGQRSFTTAYNAELSTSWEVDLFGKIGRTAEAANANYLASRYDQQALTHSLIAQVLTTRIAVAIDKHLLDLAQKNVENRQKIYELVERRYNLGVRETPLSAVYLARENIAAVQADSRQYDRTLAEDTYTLDVLLGQMPGTTNPLESDFPLLVPPLDTAICLPADLLDRRPDLRASELRTKAANADIGIAIADLYPALNIDGALGFSGSQTANLLNANQLAGSILGAVTARLFEGGKLRANIRIAESEAREQTAAYAEDVLNAIHEVETALKAEQTLAEELAFTENGVNALREAERLSFNRFMQGIETLQSFLETQQSRYAAEQTLLLTQQARWNARIALYLALGGDWLTPSNTTTHSCHQRDAT
ncbi:MAG: efflux transporter outer membrane subunit [Bdellovibrionales bacterium]